MKIFVTGVGGQLGHDVMNDLAARGYEGIGSDIAPEYSGAQDGTAVTTMPYVSMDITDAEAVEKIITEVNPDVVIHCAAWTAVDLAEDDDKVEKVHAINAGGTQNIANVCKKLDCKMVYISTDYVFGGEKAYCAKGYHIGLTQLDYSMNNKKCKYYKELHIIKEDDDFE